MEKLEARDLLAGDVAVSVHRGDLVVEIVCGVVHLRPAALAEKQERPRPRFEHVGEILRPHLSLPGQDMVAAALAAGPTPALAGLGVQVTYLLECDEPLAGEPALAVTGMPAAIYSNIFVGGSIILLG